MLQTVPKMEEKDIPKKRDCFDSRGKDIKYKIDLCKQWELQKTIDQHRRSIISYLELYRWPDTVENAFLRDLWNKYK